MQYRIFVSGASLQIACGGAFSSRKGVEQFAEEFLSGRLGEVLSEGSHGALASVLAPTVIAPVEGTTVRIMTLNIMPERLGIQKYPNVLSVDERAEIFAGMLLCYTPDVIGLQETKIRSCMCRLQENALVGHHGDDDKGGGKVVSKMKRFAVSKDTDAV